MSDLDNILKEGWLLKQSKFVKDWRRRWFVLTASALYSYKTNAKPYAEPTEVLYLKNCTTVKSIEDQGPMNFTFRIDGYGRTFYLVADNNGEKESWIGCIGRQMVRPSVLMGMDDEF